MNRTLKVVRMQLVNTQTFIWVPLLVLGGSFLITLAIYAIIASAGVTTNMYGGGAQAPLWYFAVVGAQALTLTFPFSQAMSVTRRELFLGSMLAAAMTSAMLAIIFVLGGLIETATNGWGMNGYFFALDWVWAAGPLVAGLFFFVLAMLSFVIGFWGATIYKRFGTFWLTAIVLAFAALLVVGLFITARMDAWVAVFTWFADLGAGGMAALVAGLALLLGGLAFPTLRRAVP